MATPSASSDQEFVDIRRGDEGRADFLAALIQPGQGLLVGPDGGDVDGDRACLVGDQVSLVFREEGGRGNGRDGCLGWPGGWFGLGGGGCGSGRAGAVVAISMGRGSRVGTDDVGCSVRVLLTRSQAERAKTASTIIEMIRIAFIICLPLQKIKRLRYVEVNYAIICSVTRRDIRLSRYRPVFERVAMV